MEILSFFKGEDDNFDSRYSNFEIILEHLGSNIQ